MALATLALVVLGLAVPLLSQVFVDQVLVGEQLDRDRPVLTLLALARVARRWADLPAALGLGPSRDPFDTGIGEPLHLARTSPADRVLRAALERRGRRPVALNDQIARLLSGELATNALNLVMVGVFAVLMAPYDVPLTGVTIAVCRANLLALRS